MIINSVIQLNTWTEFNKRKDRIIMKRKMSVFFAIVLIIVAIAQCAVSDGCKPHGTKYTYSQSSTAHSIYINGKQHVTYIDKLGWCSECHDYWTYSYSVTEDHHKIYRNYVDRRDYVCAECNHVFSTHMFISYR